MTDKLARGIWPALVTPFTDDGSALAPERVAPLIGHLLEQGSKGFFVCGGTGEGIAMSVSERKAMADATIAAVSGQVPLILQVGATATDNAVELAKHAAQAGADAVASVAPVDRPNDLEAAVAHYTAIGAASAPRGLGRSAETGKSRSAGATAYSAKPPFTWMTSPLM